MNISDRIFNGERAKADLEDELWEAGVQFEEASYDDYDYSCELFDVAEDYRLSSEAQKILHEAGFAKVYLNHIDKWETHYTFEPGEYKEIKGWRVSYPSKRGKDEKGILVEEPIESWPKEWFETGYAVVKKESEN